MRQTQANGGAAHTPARARSRGPEAQTGQALPARSPLVANGGGFANLREGYLRELPGGVLLALEPMGKRLFSGWGWARIGTHDGVRIPGQRWLIRQPLTHRCRLAGGI